MISLTYIVSINLCVLCVFVVPSTRSLGRMYPQQTPGTVLVFPSFMPHGVEPVTKGVRYSVVTWMVGPYFK